MLLDFNPFCEMTDALLFTWEELRCGSVGGGEGEGPSGHTPELRVVEFGSTIRPSDLSSSRVPKVRRTLDCRCVCWACLVTMWACLLCVSGRCV